MDERQLLAPLLSADTITDQEWRRIRGPGPVPITVGVNLCLALDDWERIASAAHEPIDHPVSARLVDDSIAIKSGKVALVRVGYFRHLVVRAWLETDPDEPAFSGTAECLQATIGLASGRSAAPRYSPIVKLDGATMERLARCAKGDPQRSLALARANIYPVSDGAELPTSAIVGFIALQLAPG
jgi:hypothetical protein